jgi:hypothetical protein
LVGYSVFSIALVVTQGFHIRGFDLPETVLAIVVGSTAVSAIGLVGLILQGLFRSNG